MFVMDEKGINQPDCSSSARGLASELTPVPLVAANLAAKVFAFEHQEKILRTKNVAAQNEFILE